MTITTGPPDQLALALPGLDVTPVGADTLGIAQATALDALRAIRPVGKAWRWLVGDLVLALCGHDLTRQHEAWQALAGLDIDHQPSLMRSVLVASVFPLERRRESLSWSHHEAVHHLSADEADEWLRLAALHRWSCHTLNERLKASREQHRQDPLPGTVPWRRSHAATLAALDKVFADDPEAVVVVTGDGAWKRLDGAEAGDVRAVIETEGVEG